MPGPGKPFVKGADPRRKMDGDGRTSTVQEAGVRLNDELAAQCTPEALRAMVAAVVQQAMSGDLDALSVIYDRLIGKPKQAIDNTVHVPNDVTIRYVR